MALLSEPAGTWADLALQIGVLARILDIGDEEIAEYALQHAQAFVRARAGATSIAGPGGPTPIEMIWPPFVAANADKHRLVADLHRLTREAPGSDAVDECAAEHDAAIWAEAAAAAAILQLQAECLDDLAKQAEAYLGWIDADLGAVPNAAKDAEAAGAYGLAQSIRGLAGRVAERP